jgi:hypothetical protein
MENEESANEDFKTQLKSLEEIYAQSTLKEKHKLNEHIRHILQRHGDKSSKEVEGDLG